MVFAHKIPPHIKLVVVLFYKKNGRRHIHNFTYFIHFIVKYYFDWITAYLGQEIFEGSNCTGEEILFQISSPVCVLCQSISEPAFIES